jgi:hypothetical protein
MPLLGCGTLQILVEPEDGILHSHRRENLKSYIQSCYIATITLFLFYLHQRDILNMLEEHIMHSSGNEVARFKGRLFIISSLVLILCCPLLSSENLHVSSVSMAA